MLIVLEGNDLALTTATGIWRAVTIEGLYTSSLGSNRRLVDVIYFQIDPVEGVD